MSSSFLNNFLPTELISAMATDRVLKPVGCSGSYKVQIPGPGAHFFSICPTLMNMASS